MKLKNLFLATLAAMAMVSCSNDNDPINADGGNGEQKALVQFSMSFPAGSTTRATETGLDVEQEFENLNFYIKSNEGVLQTVHLTKGDFKKDGNTYTLNNPITANFTGPVTYYVVMNPGNAGLEETPTFDEIIDGGYTNSMDALLENIAKSNEFVMTGSSNGNIVPNQINDATVSVSRVAAKLEENTPEEAFVVTDVSASDGSALKIKFENYTYVNLNTKANLFGYDPFTDNPTFFQSFSESSSFADYHAKEIGNEANITYCMANAAAPATQVIYEATALWGEATEGATFYVHKGIAYKSFIDLNNGYGSTNLGAHPINLDDASEPEKFAKYGIQKFVGGKCYYIQNIKTGGANGTNTIVRNNVYKLTVKSVSSWGLPEITPPGLEEPTLITLEVIQEPWTINVNDFGL